MSQDNSKISWITGVSTTFSFLICYGTLAIINLLSRVGVAVALNDTLWAGAIVATASLAVGGLLLGMARHRKAWPVLIGGIGAIFLSYAMYIEYLLVVELGGFILLSIAAFWDWRLLAQLQDRLSAQELPHK